MMSMRRIANLLPAADQHSVVRCMGDPSRRLASFSSYPLLAPNSGLLDLSAAPHDFHDSAVIYQDFISDNESALLVNELNEKLKRRRYEKGHWDAVIINYKEIELSERKDDGESLSDVFLGVLERVRYQLLHKHLQHKELVKWLPCHAIDLHKDGELNAHVDSVRFSGDIVAGLSLLSSSVMRLKPHKDGHGVGPMEGHVDVYLPAKSLYVLSGTSRYRYSHELLASGSLFNGKNVYRDQRMSLIFRDSKNCES
jgi:alkylated DNA repair protein alkB family protein 7